jgi:hypothetical protein
VDWDNYIRIVNILNPQSPNFVKQYDMLGGNASDVYLVENYAYVASSDSGLKIIDVSNPLYPQKVKYYNIGEYVTTVKISGDYAHTGGDAINVINVNDPKNPLVIGHYTTGTYIVVSSALQNYIYGFTREGFLILQFDTSSTNRIIENEIVHHNSDEFILNQNFPNPFNTNTVIQYAISDAIKDAGYRTQDNLALQNSHSVSLKIYSITGQLIRTLVEDEQQIGYYSVIWDGVDDNEKEVNSGIYICRLQITINNKEYNDVKKMIVIR